MDKHEVLRKTYLYRLKHRGETILIAAATGFEATEIAAAIMDVEEADVNGLLKIKGRIPEIEFARTPIFTKAYKNSHLLPEHRLGSANPPTRAPTRRRRSKTA